MNIDEITRIAELMTAHNLTEFLVESPELKITLKRTREGQATQVVMAAAPVAAPVAAPAAAPVAAPAPAAAPAAAPAKKAATVDSPIVGTFYSASAPDAPSFVKVGDRIKDGTVLCIIEAMKVMNEIKSEKSGVISKILVENGKPVEYGQPLFELEEA